MYPTNDAEISNNKTNTIRKDIILAVNKNIIKPNE